MKADLLDAYLMGERMISAALEKARIGRQARTQEQEKTDERNSNSSTQDERPIEAGE